MEKLEKLSKYDPTDPEYDFDALKAVFDSRYSSFNYLSLSLSTSIISLSLLQNLDFTLVLQDAIAENKLPDLIRWIGFIPSTQVNLNKFEFYHKFSQAAILLNNCEILTKLIRIGQAKIVANCKEWKACHRELFQNICIKEKDSSFGDNFMIYMLHRVEENQELSCFFHNLDILWVGSILLNRKVIKPEKSLFVLLNNTEVNENFIERFILVWSDKVFIQSSNLERHLQITGIVRFCLKKFGNKNEVFISNLVHGVQDHLECNVEEKRIIGMIVAEEFSLYINYGDQKLDFGYDKSKFNDIYGEILHQDEMLKPKFVPETVETRIVETSYEEDDFNMVIQWPWPKVPDSLLYESKKDELDDEICSLEAYDLHDNPLDGFAMVPKQLSQIPGLITSDKPEDVKNALKHLTDLIRVHAKRQDTKRRAHRLVWTLLQLDNKFNLENFEFDRNRALVTLVVCVPMESTPTLAKAVYSREINVGMKIVCLETIVEGARILADGGYENDEDDSNLEPNQTLTLKETGTIRRKSKNLIQKQNKPKRNELSPIVYDYFFSPLCRRIADFETEPILLCKIVTTLAFLLERARHVGGAALKMAESIAEILPWLKFREEAEIRRATLYALAALSTISLNYTADWKDWIHHVSKEDSDEVVREMATKLNIFEM